MNRREHLKKSALLAGGLAAVPSALAVRRESPVGPAVEGRIMTVMGPIAPEAMGTALPHEHLASRFGAPPARRPDYDEARLFEAVVPALRRVRELGADTVADATAAYFGRAPRILKQLSERTGMNVLTNTGYYGAADDRYVPEHAYEEEAGALAARWLEEWREGIDGTGIRPGFIKTAVDGGPLSEIDRKLVRAAARTHLESGLTIAVHTGDNVQAATEQLAVLREEGVAPAAWIWVHAHDVRDPSALAEAAQQGAWIEFDNIGPDAIEQHVELVQAMKQRRLLEQVLLSHDGDSFPIAKWSPRPYDTLFTTFLPRLREAGFSETEVRQLTVENPRRAFTVRVRAAP